MYKNHRRWPHTLVHGRSAARCKPEAARRPWIRQLGRLDLESPAYR